MNLPSSSLQTDFDALDGRISALGARVLATTETIESLLASGAQLAAELLRAYAGAQSKPMPEGEDLLELFKAFVKGDPSLNAVRDNIRELVFYQNCIAMDRRDALPAKPERMVAHTVRHVYLYLRSRGEQDGLIG